jgi:hypothetical protein
VRQWIGSHLTFANVVSLAALFVALGGTATAVTYVVSSNSQIGPNTVSGHKPPTGKHSNLIAGSINGQDVADNSLRGADITESSLGIVPNANKLDGTDSSGFLGSGNVQKLFYDDAPGNGLKSLATIGPYTIKADCTNNTLAVYANGPAGTSSYSDFVAPSTHSENQTTIAANSDAPTALIFPTLPANGFIASVAGTAMLNTGSVVIQVDYFGTAVAAGFGNKCTLYGTATMGT